jgi:SAM-dependent methyltransferase
MSLKNTERFSNRVEDYVKYRPGYPPEIISYLQEAYTLTTDKTIADIGAGTGISTELFLKAGYTVTAIEPNKEMRDKCVALLQQYPHFTALDGTAENTTLPAHSTDAIIAGQAFHWFDREKCKTEFKRILKPNGLVILIWNERRTASDFEKEYDQLIVTHSKDYLQVDHRNIDDEKISAFFAPAAATLKIFANRQVFDFDGLTGRLLSSSYMPSKEDAGYPAMMAALTALFNSYSQYGLITIHYDTKVYTGLL